MEAFERPHVHGRRPAALPLLLGLFLLGLATSPGCIWLRRNRHADGPLPPPSLAPQASLAEVIEAVNANTRSVRQLQSEGASLRIVGVPPTLSAELALERPRHLRLTAQVSRLTGKELDLGSNDERFWLWVRRNPQPAVFFARHDRFAQSQAAQWLSVNPVWLVDAIGMTQLDPDKPHEGPIPRETGQIELRTKLDTPRGQWTRVLVIDARYGWVLEQHLYDAVGRLIASAIADRFHYYQEHQASLPHTVRIRLNPDQPAELDMDLSVVNYQINQLYGNPDLLWQQPTIDGAPEVDVTGPGFVPQMLAPAPARVPPAARWPVETARRPPPAFPPPTR